MFLEVMIEDVNGGEVDQDELNQWVDQYGLTMPVISDPSSSTMWSFASGSVGLPYTVLLDKGAVVVSANHPTEADIDQLLGN